MNIEALQKMDTIVLIVYTYGIGPIMFAYMAKQKGKNPWLMWVICMILTPYIGGLLFFYGSYLDNLKKKRDKKK